MHDARADKQTVCTITVNSADEKETFRRHLSADKYQFVELVERDRPDWLESACRTGIRCDVLVISGHYDGGNEFFSDRLEAREFLPVAEMERVSCSDSCPGLFSKLKEVYLFGCNTLNPEAQRSTSAEVVRSLVREGKSPAEAARVASALNARHGESSRDRMRQVFKDVPVIYGFSSVAPLGPTAASTLNRYFQTTGNGEVGSGRASSRMLAQFAPHAMAVTRGITDADPHAGTRRDVCQFADDRLSNAQKLGFVHSLLRRQTAEARMFLDRLERQAATLDDAARQPPDVAAALAAIAAGGDARDRFLDFARDADAPAVRARMFSLAGSFGWLSAEERRTEVIRMLGDLLSRNVVGAAEVDLACTLNKDGDLSVSSQRLPPTAADDGVAHAAVRACLGSAEGHARTLEGLLSSKEADVRVAQTYLRHHPIDDVEELRDITARVAQMNGPAAQVRALEALGRHRMSDPQSLESLTRLYRVAQTWNVQTAIAGILIRADYSSLKGPEFVRTLQEHRRKSPEGDDMIDALIRRLQAN
ncbi:MAG: hypothetical protein ABI593_02510 [Betaproteobacteria bacterium]